jgi:hypothetical protein
MSRGRDTRLGRLTIETARFEATTGLDRSTSSAWKIACAIIRDGLVRAGLDPDCAVALRLQESNLDWAEPGGPLALRDLEEGFGANDHDGLAGVFATKIGEISRRFGDGYSPDLASASMAELLAWVLYRRGS